MNYRQVYHKMCRMAAQHLQSLEVYDEFDVEDERRVERALKEIQAQLYRKAERAEKPSDG